MDITSSHYTLIFCLFQKDGSILYDYYEKFKKSRVCRAYSLYGLIFSSDLAAFLIFHRDIAIFGK